MSPISEDDNTSTGSSWLVLKAEMRHNRMKDFMNANKHLFAYENKTIQSYLLRKASENKQQIFIPGSF